MQEFPSELFVFWFLCVMAFFCPTATIAFDAGDSGWKIEAEDFMFFEF